MGTLLILAGLHIVAMVCHLAMIVYWSGKLTNSEFKWRWFNTSFNAAFMTINAARSAQLIVEVEPTMASAVYPLVCIATFAFVVMVILSWIIRQTAIGPHWAVVDMGDWRGYAAINLEDDTEQVYIPSEEGKAMVSGRTQQ